MVLITEISTDFRVLVTKGKKFITKDGPIQYFVSTNLILRESL
jgi:hypothetical protein